jgi:hypothetical protein
VDAVAHRLGPTLTHLSPLRETLSPLKKKHIVARQKCGADEPPNHLHPLIPFFRGEGSKKGNPKKRKEIEFVPFRATLRSKSAQQVNPAKSHNSTDCIPLRMDTGKQRERRSFTRENVYNLWRCATKRS